MKAVICTRYGPPEVLQLQEVAKPTPRDNEVLIKIHATTVHIGDTKIRGLRPDIGPVVDIFFKPLMRIMLGFSGPRAKIMGMELAGTIEATGKDVTRYKPGDEVFASNDLTFGAYAEYICLPEDGVMALKPENMSFEEAAPVSNGAITAHHLLKKGHIRKGQKVLVYGASGSVGTFAVQLAKYFGAEVTGVCSRSNLEMVASLGADRLLDYTSDGFSAQLEQYDMVFDAVGKMEPALRKQALRPEGTHMHVIKHSSGMKMTSDDMLFLRDRIEEGSIKTIIDRTYTLEQIVEAHAYVEQGHKRGHVVVRVG
ncbi:MAG: NAD(P)-dependent alcohol dehydrogenase [Candidatus Marinimicrobia bacterium]|nr:NAD(P)-dependent alcohol dehydrogenase [Candidatus Neomarinimicrobiota bacterium]MCF7850726.1 NAD(P)-dependent alcohol dehydrogenase [Candidatus Neomarinimicrobiota bacterium]